MLTFDDIFGSIFHFFCTKFHFVKIQKYKRKKKKNEEEKSFHSCYKYNACKNIIIFMSALNSYARKRF